jgi:ubiquinone/menaquinone biosynthesis C-methylase UbiE
MPTARYDAAADFYIDMVRDELDDAPSRALLELVGEVRGERWLDLACGHGRLSRELARRGAAVTGIDVSHELLDRARDVTDPALRVTYVEGDATSKSALQGESFDGVACHFGLLDIDDLDGALATVARVLRDDGRFVFSTLHPAFPGWGSSAPPSWSNAGYYAEGWFRPDTANLRARVGSNHRMLSTYLNALLDHGLRIERVAEPEPGEAWQKRNPGAPPVPVFLVVAARRASPSSVAYL